MRLFDKSKFATVKKACGIVPDRRLLARFKETVVEIGIETEPRFPESRLLARLRFSTGPNFGISPTNSLFDKSRYRNRVRFKSEDGITPIRPEFEKEMVSRFSTYPSSSGSCSIAASPSAMIWDNLGICEMEEGRGPTTPVEEMSISIKNWSFEMHSGKFPATLEPFRVRVVRSVN
jgi:hypothetical protein